MTPPDGVACSTVSLGLATYAHGAPVTVDFDDLTFEAMS